RPVRAEPRRVRVRRGAHDGLLDLRALPAGQLVLRALRRPERVQPLQPVEPPAAVRAVRRRGAAGADRARAVPAARVRHGAAVAGAVGLGAARADVAAAGRGGPQAGRARPRRLSPRRLSPRVLPARGQPSADSIALVTAGSSGVVWGANRARTLPSPPTRNFSKFQRMSPVWPSASGVSTSCSYSGWRPSPFTSTFSVRGNVTP